MYRLGCGGRKKSVDMPLDSGISQGRQGLACLPVDKVMDEVSRLRLFPCMITPLKLLQCRDFLQVVVKPAACKGLLVVWITPLSKVKQPWRIDEFGQLGCP